MSRRLRTDGERPGRKHPSSSWVWHASCQDERAPPLPLLLPLPRQHIPHTAVACSVDADTDTVRRLAPATARSHMARRAGPAPAPRSHHASPRFHTCDSEVGLPMLTALTQTSARKQTDPATAQADTHQLFAGQCSHEHTPAWELKRSTVAVMARRPQRSTTGSARAPAKSLS